MHFKCKLKYVKDICHIPDIYKLPSPPSLPPPPPKKKNDYTSYFLPFFFLILFQLILNRKNNWYILDLLTIFILHKITDLSCDVMAIAMCR